jgi:hypothetical protein
MNLETYWLVVPLVGIALTVPLWAWLLFGRRAGDLSAQPPGRRAVLHAQHRVADALRTLADTLEAQEEEADGKRGDHPPAAADLT